MKFLRRNALRKQSRRAARIWADRTPAQSLLISVADEPEWGAGFGWAMNTAADAGLTTADHRRHFGVGVVADLLNDGYIELGELSAEGFVSWQLAPGEALLQLDARWRNQSPGTWDGETAWLIATERGLAESSRILASEDWSWRDR